MGQSSTSPSSYHVANSHAPHHLHDGALHFMIVSKHEGLHQAATEMDLRLRATLLDAEEDIARRHQGDLPHRGDTVIHPPEAMEADQVREIVTLILTDLDRILDQGVDHDPTHQDQDLGLHCAGAKVTDDATVRLRLGVVGVGGDAAQVTRATQATAGAVAEAEVGMAEGDDEVSEK